LTNQEYLQQDESDKAEWEAAEERYEQILQLAKKARALKPTMRKLAQTDLFFLMTRILKLQFIYNTEKPWWIFKRCQMVQENTYGYLDIWAREHFKSTIITFSQTIQEIIADPEVTICIFSFNRPIAKKFLIQIKRELETNETLKWLFPDILWKDPKKQYKKEGFKWTENEGITVKRKGNPKEATVEAWGLVDGQPTSKHFKRRKYDDVITRDSVTSPEVIKKVTGAWELSLNLGQEGGTEQYIGTFYHYADTYRTMIDRGAVRLRKFPCFHNGKEDGVNVLQTNEYLRDKRKKSGSKKFAEQMLCDPKEEGSMGFKREWLKFWPAQKWNNMNTMILVDPASKKKKSSDYTTFWVIGLGSDRNFYAIDVVRDKLNLTERARVLFKLHREYRPVYVYYEEYGIQADREHFEFVMNIENYRFQITPIGGRISKEDRIQALVPIFETGRFYLMETCVKVNYEKDAVDLVKVFIDEEYLAFPFGGHDDMIDDLARITDENVDLPWPEQINYGDTLIPDDSGDDYDPLTYGL